MHKSDLSEPKRSESDLINENTNAFFLSFPHHTFNCASSSREEPEAESRKMEWIVDSRGGSDETRSLDAPPAESPKTVDELIAADGGTVSNSRRRPSDLPGD